jgi:hypothetical protein
MFYIRNAISGINLLFAAILLSACSGICAAQVGESTAGPVASDVKKDPTSQDETRGTSNNRLFGVLPNFLTVENAGEVPPLTVAQKFKTCPGLIRLR